MQLTIKINELELSVDLAEVQPARAPKMGEVVEFVVDVTEDMLDDDGNGASVRIPKGTRGLITDDRCGPILSCRVVLADDYWYCNPAWFRVLP